MTRPWTELVWSDLVGRARVIRVRTAVADQGVPVPCAVAQEGYDGLGGPMQGWVRAVPDWATARPHPWDDEATIVVAELRHPDGSESDLCSRSVLRRLMSTCASDGFVIQAAAELEFFLLDPVTGGPLYNDIDQYSITKGAELEPVMHNLRTALAQMDVPVEATNPEYAGGQVELNIVYCDGLAAADRAVLARYATRFAARSQGLDATFMAKPWTDNAGSGMHVHQSLWRGDDNVMHGEAGLSNVGGEYVTGLLTRIRQLAVLGSNTPNAYHRRADYSFAPTVVCWGSDNRTLAIRAITGSPGATRVEQRDASADCNIYLTFAGQFAAGYKGTQDGVLPPPPVEGNAYARRDLELLPETFTEALACFEASTFARELLGPLYEHLLRIYRTEHAVLVTSCSDWERERYLSAI